MERIELKRHDSQWVDLFERERDRIRNLESDHLCGVFHIGSTAIPGLSAKPVVDVLAIYRDPESLRRVANALVDGGYEVGRDDPDWKVLDCSMEENSVVLHLRTVDSDGWRDQLVFREYLRNNPEKRTEYEQTKQTAAADHPHDVDAYTNQKESTILSLTEQAYEEGYDEHLPNVRRNDQ